MVSADPRWYVLGFLDEELVSRVGILVRTITVDKESPQISGVCTVVAEPAHRGLGAAAAD